MFNRRSNRIESTGMLRLHTACLLVLLGWATACDFDPFGTGATAGSNAQAAIAPLDAEQARGLVEKIVPQVEELRGLSFTRSVPVELIDDDQARAHLLRRLGEFQSEVEILAVERAYKLLGLLPPEIDIVEAYLGALGEQAGGFYDPTSGSFYVLSDMPAIIGPMIVAHELTHALEDQHFDLDARLRGALQDDDRIFALASVHEGSATLLMTVHMTGEAMQGRIDPLEIQAWAAAEAEKAELLGALPPLMRRQLVGPYVLGLAFVTQGSLLSAVGSDFPAERVDGIYRDGPVSSEQILHPERYWEVDSRDEPRTVRLVRAGRALGARWEMAGGGVLGELSLGLLVGAPTPVDFDSLDIHSADAWTNEAATGWDGDRWELWVRGEQAVVLLGTVWDSRADAEEFAAALPETGLRWKRNGDRVAIVAGDVDKRRGARALRRILRAPLGG